MDPWSPESLEKQKLQEAFKHVDKDKNYVETGYEDDESGAPIQFGNKTECGIIEFGDKLGLKKYHELRAEKNERNGGVAKQFNFDHIKIKEIT